MIGESVSHYRVLEEIGRGGAGIVYLAHDDRLEREVALKVLAPDIVASEERRNRFVREARTAASLQNPYIAVVHDIDEFRGNWFLVMEYIRGRTLDAYVVEQQRDIEVSLSLALKIAEGLGAAHRKGIVHRDLKPGNVLVTETGQPKLIDFGLAKLTEVEPMPEADHTPDRTLIGTVAYMSPEQAKAEEVDPRSDIFGLGVVLFEMLSGRLPFKRRGWLSTLNAICRDPVPRLKPLSLDLPKSSIQLVQNVLERCMEKEPGRRYQKMEEVIAALELVYRDASGMGSLHTVSALKSAPDHLHNLPPQQGPFLGRESEMERIASMLEDPTCRLLTLTGPGGVGKSRLAVEAAARRLDDYPQGVWLVSLAPLTSAEEVYPAALDALGVPASGERDPRDQLLQFLRNRETLLLFDNFEHVAEAASGLAAILETASGVKLLVTSRENLNLRGEVTLPLSGLSLESGESGQESGAMTLLLESARRQDPDIELDAEEIVSAARVCALVGGLPLGIELAATWSTMLSFSEIAGEIEGSLDFLESTARDLPERHRSLRAVFDQTWARLDPKEQEIFLALSVFRDGFSRQGADFVAGAGLPVLKVFLQKSLVRKRTRSRFEIHELLRQFASQRLEGDADRFDRIREKYCEFYASFLAQRVTALHFADQKRALEEVEEEAKNLRAFWEWTTTGGMFDALEAAIDGGYWFYEGRSRFREGSEVLDTIIRSLRAWLASDPGNERKRRLLAKALGLSGFLMYRLSLFDQAFANLEESLAIARELDDTARIAESLNDMGHVLRSRGELARAIELLQEALSLRRAADDPWGTANSLHNLAVAEKERGRLAKAKELFDESLRSKEDLGDRLGISFTLNELGGLSEREGDFVQAQSYFEQALAINQEIGNPTGTTLSLFHSGRISLVLGERSRARELLTESLAIARKIGFREAAAQCRIHLGRCCQQEGDLESAEARLREAARGALGIGARPIALEALVDLANLRMLQRDPATALRIVGNVLNEASLGEEPRRVAETIRSRLSAQLGAPSTETSLDEGRRTPLADLLDYE